MKTTIPKTQALEIGARHRSRLELVVHRALTSMDNSQFPHTYIYSPPGLGKTFTVNQTLKSVNYPYFEVSGAVSMFSFGVALAVIRHNVPLEQKVVISVDDCDGIFKTEETINIMKNVLTGKREFSYQKSLNSLISNLPDAQKESIERFSSPDRLGFCIPTDNMIFIFTSNFKLPNDDEVTEAREKSSSASVLKVHRNAIRSRCKTIDFELTPEEQWGWIADVVYKNTQLSDTQKQVVLDWMWNYWEKMTERSIRTIEKMVDTMTSEPHDYLMSWEIDYLK